MAGLGTAGILVLGAAILFTLASAVVAFNGWPAVGGGGAPANQLVTARPQAGARGQHRVPVLAASVVKVVAPVKSPPAPVPRSGAGTGRASGSAARRVSGSSVSGRLTAPVSRAGSISTHPVTRSHPTAAPTHAGSPAPTRTTTTAPAPGPVATTVGTVVKTTTPVTAPVTTTAAGVTSTVTSTVATTTSAAAGTVTKVVGTVGKPAQNVASTVSDTASHVSSSASGLTGTVSGVVAGVVGTVSSGVAGGGSPAK